MEEISSNWTELKAFFLKILAPALVGISIKLAVQSTKKKVSIFQVIVSFITGIGSAYLFSDIITDNISGSWSAVYVAIVAISGEKIGAWLTYKLNVDNLIQIVLDNFRSK